METPNANETPQTHEDKTIPDNLRRPSTLKVIVVFVLFLALLGALFVVGYVPHQRTIDQAHNDAADLGDSLPVVSIAKPRQQNGTSDVVLPCDLRPNQETAIFARANGYISKLYVDINDEVKEGQLLAEIATPEVDAQLNQSRANLDQAKANWNKAKSDADLARHTLERYMQLPAGTISNEELDQHVAAVEDADSTVTQTAAAIKVAEADIQRLTVLQGFVKVLAPFSGKITARNYDVGALVNPSATAAGQELFRLAQNTTLKAIVYVPQNWSTDIKAGEPALLDVRNYPGKQFKGNVYRASGQLSSSTRTMLYEILFDNSSGNLAPGMYGQVHLTLSSEKPALVIPTAALIFDSAGTRVAVVHGSHVHLQNVTVGRDFGTELEVLSGISSNDDVISNPAGRLDEGALVKVSSSQKAVAQVQ